MGKAEKTDVESERKRDLTRELAGEVLALRFETLSRNDRDQLARLIFDHLVVARRGAETAWSRAVQDYVRRFDMQAGAPVLGALTRTAPALATLANATAAHGLELDDTHDESISHPGALVIAAALAVAADRGADGKQIMAAIAAGYEAVGRIGAATGADIVIERGYHPTALFCGFGAAATAAHLMGFDTDRLVAAWGLVLSMAGGSMQFSLDASGTAVKRLHGGYAGHNGVTAAELAERGIAGPARAFDGQYGLCRMYGDGTRLDRLAKTADTPLEIHRISFKPYPCCRLFHSTLDGLREVTDDFALRPDDISRVVVGGPTITVTQHMLRRPTSEMAAQYSLPFTLGAAMHYGPEAVEGFAGDALADAAVLAFADRVEAVVDDAYEAAFPAHFGSSIEIELTTGDVRRARVLDSLGTPANPMDADALRRKCARLLGGLQGVPDAEALLARVDALGAGGGVDGLLRGFT